MIDNYDSFTYNLVHLVNSLGYEADVRRNDVLSIEEADAYDKILLSPGPGIPSEAGLLLEVIKRYAPTKTILGVCLGHQAIGEVFGATLVNLKEVHHGVASQINVTADDLLFRGIESSFEAGRYHSWAVSPENFPGELEVTALDSFRGDYGFAPQEIRCKGRSVSSRIRFLPLWVQRLYRIGSKWRDEL